jgi:iron complex outermembrane receptor protein
MHVKNSGVESRKANLRGRLTRVICACVVLAPFGRVLQADAQTTPQPAPPAASNSDELATVTVTARRKAENPQDVPISLSVLSQSELDAKGIESLQALQYQVPSMNVSPGNTGRDFPIVSIRGINGQATDGQGVVTYLNEVSLPPGSQFETGGGIGLLYDLDSVQVLKGPQGTLFGRDAIGGAILYQTRRPTDKFGGYVEATGGNYDDIELTGALNVPIVDDTLMVRFAGHFDDRDGFTKSLGTGNFPNGVNLDDRHYWAARGTLTWRPTRSISNDFIFDYVSDNNHGTSALLTAVNPTSLGATLFPGLIPALGEQQALGPRTALATNAFNYQQSTLESYTDILKIDISDKLVFRNIASYNRVWSMFSGDTDGTTLPVISVGYGGAGPPSDTPYILDTYSNEAQLQGTSFDGKLKWTAGAIYQVRPVVAKYNFELQLFGMTLVGGPSQSRTESTGVYAQGTYDLSNWINTLHFTAGIRESWDYVRDVAPGDPHASFRATPWTLGLDYHLNTDAMVYLTSRKGYHTGGINNLGGAAGFLPYEPEYLTDLEAGMKATWSMWGMPAQTDLAVYRSDYTNFQNTQLVDVPGTNPPQIVPTIGNSGEAVIWGAEFEGTFHLTQRLELTTRYGWMDFAYTKFGPGANEALLNSTILANGARNKYGVGARYLLPINRDAGDLSVSADWNWQSRTTFRFGPDLQPAYGLLTVGADWNHIYGQPIGVSFFMTNALDHVYAVNSFDFTNMVLGFVGTRATTYGEPRMYGFRVHYDFGARSR